MKKITLKEIEEKFLILNPNGSIWFRESNAFVNYNGKKEYKFSFSTPWELGMKMNLITNEDRMSRKGFHLLKCGCWTNEKTEYKTCSNCGEVVNENGVERESLFSFLA